MKIFWSWQSDIDGKIARHLIRDAIDTAIKQLSADLAVEAADRPDKITLDHDRKGVPGSPALAELIYKKIRASDVFVADVTPVGVSSSNAKKKLINANVAIELGYFLGAHSDERLIMVLNTAFGERADLPFDLCHKAGPIEFKLAAGAAKEAIVSANKELVSKFKVALREMVEAHAPAPQVFTPIPSIDGDPSRFFGSSDLLVNRHGSMISAARKLRGPASPLLFLRVLPTRPQPNLSFTDASETLQRGQIRPFGHDWHSMDVEMNRWGAIAYQQRSNTDIVLNGTQLHQNREIWGFDSYLTSPSNKPDEAPSAIWAVNLEEAFQINLPSYIRFMWEFLSVPPPYEVIAGVKGVSEHVLIVPSQYGGLAKGPFLRDPLIIRERISGDKPEAVEAVLLKIFEEFFDAVGERRPTNFRSFPAPRT